MTQGHRGPLCPVNRPAWAVTVVNNAVMDSGMEGGKVLPLHTTTMTDSHCALITVSVSVSVKPALCWSAGPSKQNYELKF